MAKDDTSPLDEQYGRRLRAIREDRGFTLAQMVELIKESGIGYMNTSTLSRIETGVRPVRLTEAQVIGKILRVSVESMTSEFEDLAHYESRHRAARQWFVRFRESAVEVTEYQINLERYLDNLREMQETVDESLAKSLKLTISNFENFVAIDLATEAAALQEETRAKTERLPDTPAGRFLRHRNG